MINICNAGADFIVQFSAEVTLQTGIGVVSGGTELIVLVRIQVRVDIQHLPVGIQLHATIYAKPERGFR